jgi:hypothetical protein
MYCSTAIIGNAEMFAFWAYLAILRKALAKAGRMWCLFSHCYYNLNCFLDLVTTCCHTECFRQSFAQTAKLSLPANISELPWLRATVIGVIVAEGVCTYVLG